MDSRRITTIEQRGDKWVVLVEIGSRWVVYGTYNSEAAARRNA